MPNNAMLCMYLIDSGRHDGMTQVMYDLAVKLLRGMLACLSALISAAQCLKTLIKCGLIQTLLPLDSINSQSLPVSAIACNVDQGKDFLLRCCPCNVMC